MSSSYGRDEDVGDDDNIITDVVKEKSIDYYQEFNKFQTLFYTDTVKFAGYSNYDIKKHAFVLLNNIAKGFPELADTIGNIYSPIVKTIQSPAIIKALQYRFVNPYSYCKVPQFIYYKSAAKTTKAAKGKKNESKNFNKSTGILITGIDFDISIQQEIQSILIIDNKDYQNLKYTDKIQYIGKQLLGEFERKTELKKSKTKK